MATVLELPTVDTLREEQRALRAVLRTLRRRLRTELLLELAADAAVVLSATALSLVFLDWWFRFSIPVRAVLLVLSLMGVLAFLGIRAVRRWEASRLDELTLAMTLDRHRPGTGQQIADVLQLPELLDESDSTASPAMVRLAVQRACAAPGRLGLAVALEPEANGPDRARRDRWRGCAVLARRNRAPGGATERSALADGLKAAMAPEDLPHRDGIEQIGRFAGAARRAVRVRGPGRPAADRAEGERMDRSWPGGTDQALVQAFAAQGSLVRADQGTHGAGKSQKRRDVAVGAGDLYVRAPRIG